MQTEKIGKALIGLSTISYTPPNNTPSTTMKKSFALRVDTEVYEAIEKWAADEFRSTNGQIEWILAEALKKAKRMPKKKDSTDSDNQMFNRSDVQKSDNQTI